MKNIQLTIILLLYDITCTKLIINISRNKSPYYYYYYYYKYFFYIKAKLTVSKSVSSRWRYFFDSTHLKGCHFFSSIFQLKEEPQDFDEPCFPHNFCPSFIPSIGFWRYSSKNLNSFLAHCEVDLIAYMPSSKPQPMEALLKFQF